LRGRPRRSGRGPRAGLGVRALGVDHAEHVGGASRKAARAERRALPPVAPGPRRAARAAAAGRARRGRGSRPQPAPGESRLELEAGGSGVGFGAGHGPAVPLEDGHGGHEPHHRGCRGRSCACSRRSARGRITARLLERHRPLRARGACSRGCDVGPARERLHGQGLRVPAGGAAGPVSRDGDRSRDGRRGRRARLRPLVLDPGAHELVRGPGALGTEAQEVGLGGVALPDAFLPSRSRCRSGSRPAPRGDYELAPAPGLEVASDRSSWTLLLSAEPPGRRLVALAAGRALRTPREECRAAGSPPQRDRRHAGHEVVGARTPVLQRQLERGIARRRGLRGPLRASLRSSAAARGEWPGRKATASQG